MLAELHGKIDASAAWEDTLTAGVFGALRWLPRSILEQFLLAAFPQLPAGRWDTASIDFWPAFHTGTEPDVVIRALGWLIVVEAKVDAPFAIGLDGRHQLVREWIDGGLHARSEGLSGPLVLAVTQRLDPLEEARRQLAEIGAEGSSMLACRTWQDIGNLMDQEKSKLAAHERALVDDALLLMRRRGVRTVFEGFERQDWWAVAVGLRASIDKIEPEIAALERALTPRLADDEFVWASSSQGVTNWRSLALINPGSWSTKYVFLPYRRASWSPKSAPIVVLFDLVNVAVEIALGVDAGTVAAAKASWIPKIGALVQELVMLEGYEVAFTDARWESVVDSRPTSTVDVAWLQVGLQTHLRFRIRRTLDVDSVSTEDLRREVVALAEALETCSTLQDLLSGGSSPEVSGSTEDVPEP